MNRYNCLSFLLFIFTTIETVAQSTLALTYDLNGNRISKKLQGSSPHPIVTASPQAVSPGQPAILMAAGCPGSVQWSTGQQGPSITITETATTQYIANCIVAGCTNNGVGKVTVDLIQCVADEITAGANSLNVLYGQSVTLTAYGCPGTIQWSTGNTGSTAIVKIYGPSTTITASCIKPYCNNSVSPVFTISALPSTACATGDVLVTRQAGNWNDTNTWACGRIPKLSDEVFLGHAVTVDNTGGNARTLILGGGYVIQNNGSVSLQPN